MKPVAIVIPTLVRSDMLKRCLQSICDYAPGAEVLVINNWTHRGVARVCEEFGPSTRISLTVANHPENLGCAASWNLGIKHFFERGHDWCIVLNDDVELLEGTVEALGRALDEGLPLAWSPSDSMSAFAISKDTINKVGWFDPNFWPAYREDEDYCHRLLCAGLKAGQAPGADVKHTRSSSLNYSEFLWFQHRTRLDQQNLLYYGRKWGGVPHFERYTSPFNDSKCSLAYFPDPKPRSLGLKLDDQDRVVLDNDKPFSVRLYGSFLGNGSFARVSRGLKEGLEELGLLAGTVEVDGFDSDEIAAAPGKDAVVGLYAGNPAFVQVMVSQGRHEMNFAILAPNSSWLPDRLVDSLRERAAIVAPSEWGARVLESAGLQRFPALRHGVGRAFKVMSGTEEALASLAAEKSFRVLHLSSTERQRKGTSELVQAWKRLRERGVLSDGARLVAIVDAPQGTYPEAAGDPTIVLTSQRLNATEAQMAAIYQGFHVVCQPSRGEGFGMVPLEARACGVPVVATDCTGHSEHMVPEPLGAVVVKTGVDEPMDDGPGAVAPSLSPEDIESALSRALEGWSKVREDSLNNAESVQQTWNWAEQLRIWLKAMGLYGEAT